MAAGRILGGVLVAVLSTCGRVDAATKPAGSAKLGFELARLQPPAPAASARRAGASFHGSMLPRTAGGRVLVDAVAVPGGAARLRDDLSALGATHVTQFGSVVSAALPIARLGEAAMLASLSFVRPSVAVTRSGAVDSQGDVAMRADAARARFAASGAGVLVGTLSDSFDCTGGAASDVASGDLPAGIEVVDDGGCAFGGDSDEGRAMMQIVHDIAPGAAQAFRTAFKGEADFATGIVELATAGAQVIVDDVVYLTEPMFQDGIVAQSVDIVAAAGVSYFSAAGNNARRAYEDAFRGGPRLADDAFAVAPDASFFGGTAHDFGGGDVFQRITVPEGRGFTLSLQWDSPFASVSGGRGSRNDLDVYVLDDPPTTVLASASDPNLGLDAVELLDFANPPGSGQTHFNILITLFAGPAPGRIKYVRFGGGTAVTTDEFDTQSASAFGHPAAHGAIAVGAAFYGDTPAFGQSPALLESFSSVGPAEILFDVAGQRVDQIRPVPALVAPDGGDTTFFVAGVDQEPDGRPNFFGTSAAAPHAAGVAALLLSQVPGMAPASVASLLAGAALDMGAAGPDDDTGAGLIQADASLAALRCHGRLATIVGTSGDDDIVGTGGDDVIVGLGGDDRIRGGGGSDVICGGPGDDDLSGNAGADLLDGGPGQDRLRGGPGDDVLRGGPGDDVLRGGGGLDRLVGGAGNDVCGHGEACP
jgi:hypothetical protein